MGPLVAAFEPICGGQMIFAGLNSPIGHAAGLGFDGPVCEADLDRLEMFYRSHGAPAQLDLCPLTDPTLLELIKARGYGVAELNNVLYRAVDLAEPVPAPPGVRICRGLPEQAVVFSDILARSFFEQGDAPEGFADMLAPLFQTPEALAFVALVGKSRGRSRRAYHSGAPDIRVVRCGHAARVS